MRIGDQAEVFEITVEPNAPIADKTLQEANEDGLIGKETLIVAIEREGDDDPITPRGSTRVEKEDLLTVYSSKGATPDVTDIFGHTEDHD
jgi:trk system potassium uptake protein TrkA